MLERILATFRKLGCFLLVLVAVFAIAPLLVEWVQGLGLGGLPFLGSSQEDLVGEPFQTLVSEITRIEQLALAEYHGIVFLREKVPVSILGINAYDIDIWKHIPGVVTASIDLQGYDLAGNADVSEGDFHLTLPQPVIDTCELLYEHIAEGMSSGPLPAESAEDIALVEDAMYTEARSELIRKAVEAGILEVARSQAASDIGTVVRRVFGEEVAMVLEFSPSRPNEAEAMEISIRGEGLSGSSHAGRSSGR